MPCPRVGLTRASVYRTRGGRFDASVFLVVSVDVGVLYLYSVFTSRIEKCFTLSLPLRPVVARVVRGAPYCFRQG